jgi:hypothetical protein
MVYHFSPQTLLSSPVNARESNLSCGGQLGNSLNGNEITDNGTPISSTECCSKAMKDLGLTGEPKIITDIDGIEHCFASFYFLNRS